MTRRDSVVLLVDDDGAVRKVLAALLAQAGIASLEAESGEQALKLLERGAVDALVTDLRMPGMDGMSLLAHSLRAWPDVPVIVLTAHGSVPLAVEAMKAGAAEFLQKPFERDEVLYVVEKALLRAPNAPPPARRDGEPSLLGDAPAMRAVREMVRRAAAGNATVLIRGETGTGKELVARAIHDGSARARAGFVRLNTAALPEALLESELFGHEKGAFTGAATRKPGRVEIADRGTLFLDEIGDVSLPTQAKLLRILQEREFERLGGTETIKVDVRFVAATHQNLEAMIERGEFREDLFYRLNVIPIDVPPLRERDGDVAALSRHFTARAAEANGKRGLVIDAAAVELLAEQAWPGNVRQLENLVERLVVLSDGPVVRRSEVERELDREAARVRAAQPSSSAEVVGLDGQRREAERDAIVQALNRSGNNRSLAARLLGVSRRTLYNKLEELGIA